MRPKFEKIYMNLALDLSKRSTCERLQVGTVITSSDFKKVYSVGYNGNAKGLDNCCDDKSSPGSCGCIHSETNAIINCTERSSTDKIIFVTHLPCKMCAKHIVNLGGVKTVFYENDYRIKDSISILSKAQIKVIKL